MGEVARRLGKPFMPWQQEVADVALEIDPATGLLAYTEVGLTVPRQSGKSTWVLAKATHRASAKGFFGPRQRIVYTAQTRMKAREKWEEDYAAELENSRAFGKRVLVHKSNGNEHIRFANGSRFGIEANTEKAGHGGTLDEAYIDEAFAQADARLEQAFRPAMITRSNTQILWISTAGWLDGSPYLEAKVKRGRANVEMGVRKGLAYFEWSADKDADPRDPAVWWGCMPALGHTITEEAIADELDAMSLTDFRRAYLNQWVPKEVLVQLLIDPSSWLASLDPDTAPDGQVVFGVDTTMDRQMTSIGACGMRTDGLRHVEVVDNRAGTDWVVQRAKDLMRHRPAGFVIDPGGPAGTLIADFEAEKLPVIKMTARDLAQASTGLRDDVVNNRLRHRGDERLTKAVVNCKPRSLGDSWAFDRRAEGDSSPLLAVTLARHGHTDAVRPPSVYEERGLVSL